MDNICGDTVHFTEAGTPDVTSCPRRVAADWSAGRARFDKRMSGAADRDQARRHETMVVRAVPLWKQPNAALPGLPRSTGALFHIFVCFTAEVWSRKHTSEPVKSNLN